MRNQNQTHDPRALPKASAFAAIVALPALCALALLLSPQQAHAQGEDSTVEREEADRPTLADRIPAVSGRFFSKSGRLQVSPALGLVINDPFHADLPAGLGLHFHVFESLAIGVSGQFYAKISDTPVIPGGGGAPEPPVFNKPLYDARLELRWTPVYGKLSIMAESVFHFDTYITAFGGVMGPAEDKPSVTAGGAIGQHYFLNQWMALRVELSGQYFTMASLPEFDPTPEGRFLVGANFGFSFFFGGDDSSQVVN